MCDIAWPKSSEKYFQKFMKSIKNEVRSGKIENINNHIVAHPTKDESESVKNMVSWVESVRTFQKSTKKSGQQDIRDIFLMS